MSSRLLGASCGDGAGLGEQLQVAGLERRISRPCHARRRSFTAASSSANL